MNLFTTLVSKLLNQPAVNKQPSADIKQAQLKVLADRLRNRSFLTPKVLMGTAMIAGLWWLTNRREKVNDEERGRSIK